MRAVIQRVEEASVRIDGKVVGSIKKGMVILLGVQNDDTEEDLHQLLEKIAPDIRIQGNDWQGKGYTGEDLDIPIHYHDRLSHTYSTSNLRKRIQESEYPKTSD